MLLREKFIVRGSRENEIKKKVSTMVKMCILVVRIIKNKERRGMR